MWAGVWRRPEPRTEDIGHGICKSLESHRLAKESRANTALNSNSRPMKFFSPAKGRGTVASLPSKLCFKVTPSLASWKTVLKPRRTKLSVVVVPPTHTLPSCLQNCRRVKSVQKSPIILWKGPLFFQSVLVTFPSRSQHFADVEKGLFAMLSVFIFSILP